MSSKLFKNIYTKNILRILMTHQSLTSKVSECHYVKFFLKLTSSIVQLIKLLTFDITDGVTPGSILKPIFMMILVDGEAKTS